MKITHVRVSVLESGPGYNNRSVALEGMLEEGDNYEDVVADLTGKCHSQIKGQNQLAAMWNDVHYQAEQKISLENDLKILRANIDKARKIIRECEKIGEIAHKQGIFNEFFDEIPF